MLTLKTKDTYKAAFLMVHGARLVDISIRRLAIKGRFLQTNQWFIELEGISQRAMNMWNTGTARVNVEDFRRERLRIKKLAKTKRL